MQSYWIVDPARPSILVLDLVDGTYITTAEASASARAVVNTPFSVETVPAHLVAPPREQGDDGNRLGVAADLESV